AATPMPLHHSESASFRRRSAFATTISISSRSNGLKRKWSAPCSVASATAALEGQLPVIKITSSDASRLLSSLRRCSKKSDRVLHGGKGTGWGGVVHSPRNRWGGRLAGGKAGAGAFGPLGVPAGLELAATGGPPRRACRADEIDDHGEAHQRLTPPVG